MASADDLRAQVEAALRALDSAQTETRSALATHAQGVQSQMDSMKTDIVHGVGLVQAQVDSVKDDMSKVINAVQLMSAQFNAYVASVPVTGGGAAAASSSSSSSPSVAPPTGVPPTSSTAAVPSVHPSFPFGLDLRGDGNRRCLIQGRRTPISRRG